MDAQEFADRMIEYETTMQCVSLQAHGLLEILMRMPIPEGLEGTVESIIAKIRAGDRLIEIDRKTLLEVADSMVDSFEETMRLVRKNSGGLPYGLTKFERRSIADFCLWQINAATTHARRPTGRHADYVGLWEDQQE